MASGSRSFSAPTIAYFRFENCSGVHRRRYELQNVGVLINMLARYSPASSPMVFASIGFGWYTTLLPWSSGNHIVPVKPNEWKNGSTPMKQSDGSIGKI